MLKPAPTRLADRLLSALETRLLVVPSLKAKIAALPDHPTPDQASSVANEVVSFVRLYGGDASERLLELLEREVGAEVTFLPRDETVLIDRDTDSIVLARAKGLTLALKLGFKPTDRTKIATAISEVARNISLYAGRGVVELHVVAGPRRGIEVIAIDEGPGIADLARVFSGDYRSKHGMGLGLRGVKRVAHVFDIATAPAKGTRVRAVFYVS